MMSASIRHPFFLCTVSGILLALGFPGSDLGGLAFIGLVPLLIALKGATSGQAFRRGLGTGFVFFAIVLSWVGTFASTKIGNLGSVAWFALALVQAFFIGIFALGVNRLGSIRPIWLQLLATPSLWVICEYVRQLGSLGMGWGDLGYTQWRDPAVLHIAPLTGIWGLSWIVVLVNAAFVRWQRDTSVVAASVIATLWIISFLAIRDVHSSAPTYVAAALQANIDQDVYWTGQRPSDPLYFYGTLHTFDEMVNQASAQNKAKLVLLAETAAPGYAGSDFELTGRLSALANRTGAAVLTGARDNDRLTGKDRNIAALILPDKSGCIAGEYAKQQLVPFGEFVPFLNQLQWISVLRVANFNDEAGSPVQPPLDAGPLVGKIGVGICYESTYPRFLRQQTKSGANLLTVITDDTWFGRTAAARQHLAMSAIRAAECDRYLVRSAATGISAVFAPDGQELTEAGLFTRAVVAAPVTPRFGLTWFVRFGDWFVVFCAVFVLIAVIGMRTELRPKSAPDTPGSRLSEAKIADNSHHV